MAKIKHAAFTEATPAFSMTYAQIAVLKASNGLTAGSYYTITDNQTIHNIPYTTALNVQGTVYENAATWTNTKSEGVEPLTIMAITTSAFSNIAYSPSFPNDLIQFDFNNVLCEDGVTARRGKIIYRKDNIKNLEAFYDWRNVKFRRWKIAPVAWSAGTTYAKWAIVLASNGDTYMSKKAGNLGNDPINTPIIGSGSSAEYTIVYGDWWDKVVLGVKNQYLSYKPSGTFKVAAADMPINATDFQDFYTFNQNTSPDYKNPLPLIKGDAGLMKNIRIGQHSTYNNIIFADPAEGGSRVFDLFLGTGCADCLFYGVNINTNWIGSNSIGTICQGSWYNNNMGENFSYNYCIYHNQKYWWGITTSSFANNYTNNFHTADFNGNRMTGNNMNSNIYSWYCQRNFISGFFSGNVIGGECSDNLWNFVNGCTIGSNCKSNQCIGGADDTRGMVSSTIADNFQGNNIRSLRSAIIGLNFKGNVIEGIINTITIPDNFQYNKIFGTIAANTYFAINTQRNTFIHDFGGGTVAIPLDLKNCVFNKTVTGLQVSAVGVTLNGVISNVSIANKTIPASLADKTISQISPDGKIWYSSIDNTGAETFTSIV